jgi:3-phenylpropionate/trans-cinnamate dioxygenase ferredoxin subunit
VAEFVQVASLTQLPPGTLQQVEVDGRDICLANADGAVYAFQDNCSHRDHPLHTGTLEGTRLECAWHGGRFDVASGRAVGLPAIKPIATFDVRIEGDDILVAV